MISDERLQALGFSRSTLLVFAPLIRALLMILVCTVGVRQALVYAQIARTTVTVRHMGDFDVFYRSSQRVVRRGNPYDVIALSGTSDVIQTPNLNPPHVVLLLVPLTFVGPQTALSIWTLASLGSALLALWIIVREIPIPPTPTTVAWILLGLICAAPTGALLFSAQISWLLWGPVTWTWAVARHGRWKPAAFVLGLTMSIKPFVGMFVLLFAVQRRWAALTISAASAAVCFSIGIAALGWLTFASWMRAIGAVTWAGHIFNASVYGLLDRIFTNRAQPIWSLAPITSEPELVRPLWIFGSCGVVALSGWAIYRRQPAEAFEAGAGSAFVIDRLFAITLSAAFLISPLTWIYYHFLLAGPFIALCANDQWLKGLGWRKVGLVGAVICYMLSPGTLASGQPNGWATLSIGSAYFWGLLGLWICAVAPIQTAGR